MKLEIRPPTIQSLFDVDFNLQKKKKLVFNNKKLKIYRCDYLENKSRFYIVKKRKKFFFVKLINKNDFKIKEDQKITKFLKKKVNIPKIYSNSEFIVFFKDFLKKDQSIVCYELIENLSPIRDNDFYEIGRSLFKLHKHLNRYNEKKKFKKNTLKRISILKNVFKNFVCKSYNNKLLCDLKKILLKEENIFKEIKQKNLQALTHGDLVPSNIIKSKKKIYFLDFEDTCFSFFFKELDIVLIIERLIFCKKNISKSQKIELIDLFLKGYQENYKKKIIFDKSITYSLKFNNIKSILTILNNYDAKQSFINKELKKFIYLYSLINKNKKIINNFRRYEK